MTPRFNAHLLGISAYKPGRPIEDVKREYGLDRVIKLASNENPLGPSPMAVEAVKQAASQLNLYPDGAAWALNRAISEKFQIPIEHIMLGNGSDELIQFLGLIFLSGPDDEVIVGAPSFSQYDSSTLIQQGKLVKVPLNDRLEHDLEAMAKAAGENTKLIYIANPHNPTGTVIRKEAFERFLDRLPPHVIVVLDEAYIEFCEGDSSLPNSLDEIKAGRPVIGLRTFSKAYGLAGIRIGYGFASPEIVDIFQRVRGPFNVNSLAQAAAVAALGDHDFIRRSVAHNTAGLNRLREIFTKFGAKVYDSHANFAFADFHRPTEGLYNELMKHGIITRAGTWFGLPTFLRVTVGTSEELDRFEEVLGKILSPAVAN